MLLETAAKAPLERPRTRQQDLHRFTKLRQCSPNGSRMGKEGERGQPRDLPALERGSSKENEELKQALCEATLELQVRKDYNPCKGRLLRTGENQRGVLSFGE